jgi:hypothetical protein
MARGRMRQERIASLREWSAKLSQPSVELTMQGDHVIVQQDGKLIASGFLVSAPPLDKRWSPPSSGRPRTLPYRRGDGD